MANKLGWRGNDQVFHLKSSRGNRGSVLLSYRLDPFFSESSDPIKFTRHSTPWETRTIAKLFVDLGFDVDVIDFQNDQFVPRKEYVVALDVFNNLERLSTHLPASCKKIFHPCWSHWTFHNSSIYKRVDELRDRRGITLTPLNIHRPHRSVEIADFLTQRGEIFSTGTFDHVAAQSLPIRHSSLYEFGWALEEKNYNECRKNFLWLGGFGCLQKGLDRVLEVFSKLPQLNLYVCGGIQKDPDFAAAFQNELYNKPNIHVVGFIDTASEKFRCLAQNSVALVFPSSTEISCGGVITCMHAGLIPAISRESDVFTAECGYLLDTSTNEDIEACVLAISETSTDELRTRTLATVKLARERYTQQEFQRTYAEALEIILER